MLVLEGGAEELEAELQGWVELPNQLLNALVVSDVHVLDMVTAQPARQGNMRLRCNVGESLVNGEEKYMPLSSPVSNTSLLLNTEPRVLPYSQIRDRKQMEHALETSTLKVTV